MPKLMYKTDRDNNHDIKEIRIAYDSTILI
jgi:hypothetical protein